MVRPEMSLYQSIQPRANNPLRLSTAVVQPMATASVLSNTSNGSFVAAPTNSTAQQSKSAKAAPRRVFTPLPTTQQQSIISRLVDQRTLNLYPLHLYARPNGSSSADSTQRTVKPKLPAKLSTTKAALAEAARAAAIATGKDDTTTNDKAEVMDASMSDVKSSSAAPAPAPAPVEGNAIGVARDVRIAVLHDLLMRDPPLFLERYVSLLTGEQLDWFCTAYPTEYEIIYHSELERIKRNPSLMREMLLAADDTSLQRSGSAASPNANASTTANGVTVLTTSRDNRLTIPLDPSVMIAAGAGDAMAYASALAARAVQKSIAADANANTSAGASPSASTNSTAIADFREPPVPPPWRNTANSTTSSVATNPITSSTLTSTAAAAADAEVDYLDFPLDDAAVQVDAGMEDDQPSNESIPTAIAIHRARRPRHQQQSLAQHSMPTATTATGGRVLSMTQRNRRFELLRRLESESGYFSEAEMREREPVLYEQFLLNSGATTNITNTTNGTAAVRASAANDAGMTDDPAMSDAAALRQIQRLTKQSVVPPQSGTQSMLMTDHLSKLSLSSASAAAVESKHSGAAGLNVKSNSTLVPSRLEIGNTPNPPASRPAISTSSTSTSVDRTRIASNTSNRGRSDLSAYLKAPSASTESAVSSAAAIVDSSVSHPLSQMLLRSYDYKQKLNQSGIGVVPATVLAADRMPRSATGASALSRTTLSSAPASTSTSSAGSSSGVKRSPLQKPPLQPHEQLLIQQQTQTSQSPAHPASSSSSSSSTPVSHPTVTATVPIDIEPDNLNDDDTPLFKRGPVKRIGGGAATSMAAAFSALKTKNPVTAKMPETAAFKPVKATASTSTSTSTANANAIPNSPALTRPAINSSEVPKSTARNAAVLKLIAEQRERTKTQRKSVEPQLSGTTSIASTSAPTSAAVGSTTSSNRKLRRAIRSSGAARSTDDLLDSDESELDDNDTDLQTAQPSLSSTINPAPHIPVQAPAEHRAQRMDDNSGDDENEEDIRATAEESIRLQRRINDMDSEDDNDDATTDGAEVLPNSEAASATALANAESGADRERRLADFTSLMKERFLRGDDTAHIDYNVIDTDDTLDDIAAQDRDLTDAYFDTD